jgi:hypothetical protein
MSEPNEIAATPRPPAIYWVLALALATVLLYFSLRGIAWLRVWTILRGARLPIVALVMAIMSFNLLTRSLRWRVVLAADRRVPVSQAFWATAAGYLGNNVLPARAGELVRTLMICARTGMSKVFVLTTIFSERVVDALFLLAISGTILLTLPVTPGWLARAARPVGAIGLAGVAAIVLIPFFETFWHRLLARLPVPHRWRERAEHALRQVILGIRSFHDRGRLARFLLFTALLWGLEGVTTVLGARAIGVSFSFPVAYLLIAGLGLGSALPATPGYVGIYQFAAVSVLTPFGYSQADAIAYILLFQAMNYVVLLVWGLLGLAQQRRASSSRLNDGT